MTTASTRQPVLDLMDSQKLNGTLQVELDPWMSAFGPAMTLEQYQMIKQDQAQLVLQYFTPSSPLHSTGPIPATRPLVDDQSSDGVQWISFEYSQTGLKRTHRIRCDIENVDQEALCHEFKEMNCVYPRAFAAIYNRESYRGNRLKYETECNTIGWGLVKLNPEQLEGKRGLIQRAVDSWRNSRMDNSKRSRRARRIDKLESQYIRRCVEQDRVMDMTYQGLLSLSGSTNGQSVNAWATQTIPPSYESQPEQQVQGNWITSALFPKTSEERGGLNQRYILDQRYDLSPTSFLDTSKEPSMAALSTPLTKGMLHFGVQSSFPDPVPNMQFEQNSRSMLYQYDSTAMATDQVEDFTIASMTCPE